MSDSDDAPASEELCVDIEEHLLETSSVFGHGGSREFLPEDKMDLLLTESRVIAVLKEKCVEPTPKLIEFIFSRAKRLFLTLFWIGYLQKITTLQKANFDDGALPVDKHKGKTGISSLNKVNWTLDGDPLPAFRGWRVREISHFVDTQWRFLSVSFPVFKFYPLAYQHRLPLLPCNKSDERGRQSSGGFSSVYQLRLLRASQGGQPEYEVVAVKKFDDSLVGYFHKERRTIDKIYDIESHPHLIKPIAVFERGSDRCVLFPWAYGGNLSDFWQESDAVLRDPSARAELVSWCLGQMVGIADALRVLHHENCRHGDLKPENLLHFKDGDQRGRLVVADFGLSKFHIAATARRDGPSSNWSRTHKYEAPEIDGAHTKGKPRSRDYDMWSMGCLFLEFAVWLVNGHAYLEEFRQPNLIVKYWQYNQYKRPEVHPRAQAEMAKILQHPRASQATKDIVQLVHDRLLVVKLPEPETTSSDESDSDHPVRPSAEELLDLMQKIQQRANNSTSYLKGHRIAGSGMGDSLTVREKAREKVRERKDSGVHLVHGDEEDAQGPKVFVRAPTVDFGQASKPHKPTSHPQTYREEQTVDLNDQWGFSSDNDFSRTLFQRADWNSLAPLVSDETALCSRCRKIDLFSPKSEIPFAQDRLRDNVGNCKLCAVIYEALSGLGWGEQHGTITRTGPEFRIASETGTQPIVLSMYADPRTPAPDAEEVAQLGYPDLPSRDSPQQYEIMRTWLDTCNHRHQDCYPWKRTEDLPRMPTRVIEVGTVAEPVLRLVETSTGQLRAKYVALSHCWGQLKDEDKFCTTDDSIKDNKTSMPFDRLPKNFRDAVTVTREIGIRYLWIDSICIIQGNEADWKAEAQRMNDVFSSAYCTLAASSAESSIVGFLGPRERATRKVAALKSPGGARMYLCRSIDNFRDHVEGSVLASRGWVFQERALSRRTIHFTSTQLYWECGEGVHCETLGKLHNAKAALLSDAQFPASVVPYYKGGRIILTQHVYAMYSKLAFTHWSDRAVALLGLESRLGTTFKTRAEFGVLQEYLQRGLLWKRSETCRGLSRIEQKAAVSVPSWSWMAYQGAIDYVYVPLNDTDWFDENLESPFVGNKSLREEEDGGQSTRFKGTASGLAATNLWWKKGVTMDQGDDGLTDINAINSIYKCIVVGEQRTLTGKHAGRSDLGERLQYVLIVERHPEGPAGHYRRVGAGSLLSNHVKNEERSEIVLV
ncbi:hypothetical protein PG984_007008 [Apiospora sp. TS-2023a]